MSLDFPSNMIWYVQATPDGKGEGSAVAIKLQNVVTASDGTSKGDPNTSRTYLLTCTHVLRKPSGKQGPYGPVVDEESVRVWMPGTGRSEDQAKLIRIATEIREIRREEIPLQERSNPVEDWVVLELLDKQSAMASPALGAADWCTEEITSGEFRIYGYPGGAKSMAKGHVVPTGTGPFPFQDRHLGLLRLTGNESAAGMSGGGVFRLDSEPLSSFHGIFAGLHRAREFGTLQLHAVSAQSIWEYFEYEDVPFELTKLKVHEVANINEGVIATEPPKVPNADEAPTPATKNKGPTVWSLVGLALSLAAIAIGFAIWHLIPQLLDSPCNPTWIAVDPLEADRLMPVSTKDPMSKKVHEFTKGDVNQQPSQTYFAYEWKCFQSIVPAMIAIKNETPGFRFAIATQGDQSAKPFTNEFIPADQSQVTLFIFPMNKDAEMRLQEDKQVNLVDKYISVRKVQDK